MLTGAINNDQNSINNMSASKESNDTWKLAKFAIWLIALNAAIIKRYDVNKIKFR